MIPPLRTIALALTTLVVALLVAFVGAADILGESAHNVQSILRYVAISGGIALVIGMIGVAAGMRYLPRLSIKVAGSYAVGSLAAIFTVVYTPLLMFRDRGDLHLLVLLLVCFMVISVGLGTIIAVGLADRLQLLTAAARRVAEGHFDTRVSVPSGDELSTLSDAFNRMSAELGTSFARERAVEQGRRDLVAAISHDLRTPLSSIRAMLEAIQDGVVTEETTIRQYHQAMHDQVERLRRLIDDLFELSRLDSGSLELRLSRVDLNELIVETIDSLRPAAESRRIQLTVKPADSTALGVIVDPDQLQRVVVNLLQNAIRHTPEGGSVDVAVRATGAELTVEVADSGEGIARADIDHVFERFYRGEKARTRTDDSGAGLGLAIAKAIVEAHKGHIWAESGRARGAKFVFTVPAATA
ncbi:MAG TPA: ATP-binding protein [Chloroflexota bacterium]|jgi:signal transduction histidine kinase|nr:ATP-binding protein [Chloroflexota bacterium]